MTTRLSLATLSKIGIVGILPCVTGDCRVSQPKAITVCELFSDLQSHGGKKLAVRGIYWLGLRQPCAQPLVVLGRTWPTVLNLVDSDFVSGNEPVTFTTDYHNWDALDKLVIREATAAKREEIWVTIVGMLRTPVHDRADGTVVGGYGHLGALPAELVVERVTDIVIKANPTYDYRDMLYRRRGEPPRN